MCFKDKSVACSGRCTPYWGELGESGWWAGLSRGALGELIATAVAAAAGRAWKSLRGRGSPEARAVRNAIDVALTGALRDAVLPADTLADDAWVTEVAQVWQAAFTPAVSAALVTCLADQSKASADRFAELARQALVDSGCDLAVLGRTFWVDEFVAGRSSAAAARGCPGS
jgi:hypothetical protein